jgi:hypothetical protein
MNASSRLFEIKHVEKTALALRLKAPRLMTEPGIKAADNDIQRVIPLAKRVLFYSTILAQR